MSVQKLAEKIRKAVFADLNDRKGYHTGDLDPDVLAVWECELEGVIAVALESALAAMRKSAEAAEADNVRLREALRGLSVYANNMTPDDSTAAQAFSMLADAVIAAAEGEVPRDTTEAALKQRADAERAEAETDLGAWRAADAEVPKPQITMKNYKLRWPQQIPASGYGTAAETEGSEKNG